MKFKNRKVYANGTNKSVFLMQIPKVVCEDMQLSKDSIIDVEYIDGKIIITKQEEKQCQGNDVE